MELQLNRRYLGEEYTIGDLYIDGVFFCNTLEDKVRDLNKDGILDEPKVYAETAIPYGEYNIIVNYSPKFRRALPRLLDVPYFEGILIHRGTMASNSSGCILLGENKIKGRVINSAKYEIELTKILQKAMENKEIITIKII